MFLFLITPLYEVFHVSWDRVEEVYMERRTLPLEYFISNLNVKECEMQELHYQKVNHNVGTVYISQTLSPTHVYNK